MPEGRPEIPAEIVRAVLLEAGHRCAIPTCRHPTTEMAHIKAWARVQEHRLENLIALCPNCHTRFDKGEIDHKSIVAYKRNLPVVNSRYNDLERRALTVLGSAIREGKKDPMLIVPGGSRFLFSLALQDQLLEYMDNEGGGKSGMSIGGQWVMVEMVGALRLTAKGQGFAARWLAGQELDEPAKTQDS